MIGNTYNTTIPKKIKLNFLNITFENSEVNF